MRNKKTKKFNQLSVNDKLLLIQFFFEISSFLTNLDLDRLFCQGDMLILAAFRCNMTLHLFKDDLGLEINSSIVVTQN